MKSKRILTALLVLLMLTSCAKTTDIENAENDETSTQNTETTAIPEETEYRYYEHLPEKDLGGRDYRIISRKTDVGHDPTKYTDFGNDEIDAAELTGAPINDVVYNRNRELESRYNFRFVSIQNDLTPAKTVKTSVMAGSDDYDTVVDGLNRMSDFTMFYNLDSLSSIDLTADCWDQNANTSLSVGGKRYIAVGDMLTLDKKGTVAILFNKPIATDLHLESLYDVVREGRWTLDTFEEMLRLASTDLNGNGQMDRDDQWGFCCEDFDFGALMFSTGNRFSEKDENDYPTLTMYTDQSVDCYDRIYNIMNDASVTMNMDTGYGAEVFMKTFTEDRGLFIMLGICTAIEFRYMESDFGILPLPKKDEAQKEYLTTIFTSNSGSVAIPLSSGAPEDNAFLLQAICLASTNTLKPVFYDQVLNGIVTRDEESSEMLDILFAGRVFDLAFINDWGGSIYFYSSNMKAGKNLSSSYAAQEKKILTDMNSAIKAYKEME